MLPLVLPLGQCHVIQSEGAPPFVERHVLLNQIHLAWLQSKPLVGLAMVVSQQRFVFLEQQLLLSWRTAFTNAARHLLLLALLSKHQPLMFLALSDDGVRLLLA